MGHEHLTVAGWKKLKVRDPGLEKALGALEGARDQDPLAAVKALDEIENRIYELTRKKDLDPHLKKYLADVEKEAKNAKVAAKEEVRLRAAIAKAGAPKPAPVADQTPSLEAALRKVRSLGDHPETPLQFVACAGKELGLMVVPKVQAKHKTALADQIGARRFYEGTCVFADQAFVFYLNGAPPAGLAKRLKQVIGADTSVSAKVKVKGSDGGELDDDHDQIPVEAVIQGTPAGTPENPVAGPDVKVGAAKIDTRVLLTRLKQRLATLMKTAAYARKQAPDEKVRILCQVEDELRGALAKVTRIDPSAVVPKEAVEFQSRLRGLIDETKADAVKQVEGQVKKWNEQLNGLAASTPKLGPSDLQACHDRARSVLAAIGDIEEGLQANRAMLTRLRLEKDAGILVPVAERLKPLRDEYAQLAPKRTQGKAPMAAPPVNRPALGVLSKDFKDLVGRIEGAMATDKQTNLSELEEMVASIDTQLPPDLEKALIQTHKCSWDRVKAEFKRMSQTDKAAATKFMSEFWWFRRRTVDQLMAGLQKKYNFTWASVGSANLESDYDISIKSHGFKNGKDGERYYDYQIVHEFNTAIAKRFQGVQPGTLFDTNLYASAKVELPDPNRVKSKTEQSMEAMTEAGQDVGALMKMRRYMDWEAYEDYRNGTLGDIQKAIDDAAATEQKTRISAQMEATRRQFEEADSLYFLSLQQQLERAGKTLPRDLSPEGQKRLLASAHELEHDPDQLMATNNDLYVEAMQEVRGIEARLAPEQDPDRRAALLAALRTHQANATFFAAEAYHSEGPLKHIVEANQSSAAKVKNEHADWPKEEQDREIARLANEAIAKLSATQMLQSFNENLGDLLKDLKHYEEKSPYPGLGFYRASKYLERLCDAMEKISDKLKQEAPSAVADFTAIKIAGQSPAATKTSVAGLVDLRGGKKGFPDKAFDPANGVVDPELEKEAYAIDELRRIMPGVATLRDLAREMTAVGRQVNAALRKAELGRKLIAEDDRAYFQ